MVFLPALALLAAVSAPPDPVVALLERGHAACATIPRDGAVSTGPPAERGRQVPVPVVELGPPESTDRVRHVRWLGLAVDPVSADVPIRIEDRTVGIVIRATAQTDDFILHVELDGPAGERLACYGCADTPAVIAAGRGIGTVQMPSTDRHGSGLGAGTYTFRVRAVSPEGGRVGPSTTVDVTAALRTEADVELERLLDLNFVYLPGSTLSTEIATSDPLFEAMLGKVDEWLAPAGIRVGRVTHNDLDRPEFSQIGTRQEAARMFGSTSALVGRPGALNVYCLDRFDGPLAIAVGLSGGIPGPSYSGTRSSGVALRMYPLFVCGEGCLGAFGSLFGHEIGHYLGLYHTTETDFSNHDPILDTPECYPGQTLEECPDWLNVLFPTVGDAHDQWTPGQIRVMQNHPIVRTVPVVTRRAGPETAAPLALRAAPNPFRDRVRLQWTGRSGEAALEASVYDAAGRRIARLDPEGLAWDGRTVSGRPAPAGVYFVRVETRAGARNLRVVKLR